MDTIKIEKIQAINRYRKQQLLNKLFLYFLTTLSCSLFCSSPFWYPPLCSCMKVFLFVSLPKFISLFFSSKFLFIVGNLIAIFLVRESKIFSSVSSSASDVYYDEYLSKSQSLRNFSALEQKEERKLEKYSFEEKAKSTSYKDGKEGWGEEKAEVEEETEDLDGESLSLPAEVLNKRADDFIARVNKQRRLEAILLVSSNE